MKKTDTEQIAAFVFEAYVSGSRAPLAEEIAAAVGVSVSTIRRCVAPKGHLDWRFCEAQRYSRDAARYEPSRRYMRERWRIAFNKEEPKRGAVG